jgi:hypothetical protein
MMAQDKALEFDDVLQAVRESERGRWFLGELENRLRRAETTKILAAIGKLESALVTGASNNAAASTPSNGNLAEPPSFERSLAAPAQTAATPSEAAPVKPANSTKDIERGARLTITRGALTTAENPGNTPLPQTTVETVTEAKPVQAADSVAARDPLTDANADSAKPSRVVIIRRKPEDLVEVPLPFEIPGHAA